MNVRNTARSVIRAFNIFHFRQLLPLGDKGEVEDIWLYEISDFMMGKTSYPRSVLAASNATFQMQQVMKQDIAIQAGIYALCIALVSFLWHRPVVLFVCYLAVSVLMLSRWHTRADFTFYAVGFVLGPVGEFVVVYFGAWHYAKPFYLLPIWLPLLWGMFVLLVKKIAETLVQPE